MHSVAAVQIAPIGGPTQWMVTAGLGDGPDSRLAATNSVPFPRASESGGDAAQAVFYFTQLRGAAEASALGRDSLKSVLVGG